MRTVNTMHAATFLVTIAAAHHSLSLGFSMETARLVLVLTVLSCASSREGPRPVAPGNATNARSATPPVDMLIGRWTADARTKGGVAASLEFLPDGTMTSMFGALVDFTYEAHGALLRTRFQEEDVTEQTLRINGDVAQLGPGAAGAAETLMTRMGLVVDPLRPLVGRWSFRHYTGQEATWEYTRSGRAVLSVPFETTAAQFTATPSVLSIVWPNQTTESVGYETDGVHLALAYERGTKRFTKIEP